MHRKHYGFHTYAGSVTCSERGQSAAQGTAHELASQIKFPDTHSGTVLPRQIKSSTYFHTTLQQKNRMRWKQNCVTEIHAVIFSTPDEFL